MRFLSRCFSVAVAASRLGEPPRHRGLLQLQVLLERGRGERGLGVGEHAAHGEHLRARPPLEDHRVRLGARRGGHALDGLDGRLAVDGVQAVADLEVARFGGGRPELAARLEGVVGGGLEGELGLEGEEE